MVKAVIYARYSSHNQREESIEGQIRECRDFAERNNFTVIGEYIDRAISGKTDNRADFQRMIKDSSTQAFQAVIVYAIDRFARNRYDSANYKMRLKKNGVKVYYAKQSIPDTPEGIILESVMEGYAEYYSENLSIHIKRGMHENALQGKSTGGHIPLGYRIGADQHYEIDPAGAKIVQEIFQMYADGESGAAIARHCNDLGYRTSHGSKFNKNSFRGILTNRKYTGTYRYKDVEIEGGMPQIISQELFDKVQAMFKHNYAARAKNKANNDYLLTTKLFCGHCESPMVGESGKSKNGSMYYYYKCAKKKRKKECKKETERKDWIEQFVVETTVREVLTDERIDMIAEKAVEIIEKEAAENTVLPILKASLSDVNKRLNNLMSAIEMGVVTATTKERVLELEGEKADIEKRIAHEQAKKPALTKERIAFWLYSFRNGDVKDPTYQRRVIDTLVNSVYVYDSPDGKGREFLFTFNISGSNSIRIKSSDIKSLTPPFRANPNTFFFGKNVFGFTCKVESAGF